MDLGKKIGKTVGSVVGKTIGEGTKIVGKGIQKTKFKEVGQWVEEIGSYTGDATKSTIELTGGVIDGVLNTGTGYVKKDEMIKKEGVQQLKTSGNQIVSGVIDTVTNVAGGSIETAKGVVFNDRERSLNGLKRITKFAVAGPVYHADELDHLDDDEFPINSQTGVRYQKAKVTFANGHEVEKFFPLFKTNFEVDLPEELYQATDEAHNKFANEQLKIALEKDGTLINTLNLTQLDTLNLKYNITPENYVWHQHEIPGKLQLVDAYLHDATEHEGGREIWGGGDKKRK